MKKTEPTSATARAERMRLVGLPKVKDMTDLGRSTIYDLMKRQLFPRPVQMSRRAVRWIEQEVLNFIATRPRTRGRRRPK